MESKKTTSDKENAHQNFSNKQKLL